MRYQRGRLPSKLAPWGILAALLVAVCQGLAPAELQHYGNTIRVRLGLYDHRDLPLAQLREAKLLSELPVLGRRVAGYELGPRRRARYELAEQGTADLFLESRQPPYLLLQSDGAGTNTVIVNRCAPSDTQEAFELVQRVIAEYRRKRELK